jgi:hypothetical protein
LKDSGCIHKLLLKQDDKPLSGAICNLLIIISTGWLLINLASVYFFLGGSKIHRIESAAYIFTAAILFKIILQRKSLFPQEGNISSDESHLNLKIFLLFLPVLIWILLYIPYISTPFLSDDYVFIMKYSYSPFVFDNAGFFRPAFSSIFYIFLRIFGADPVPFRLFNLLLHLGCSVLAYKITEKLSSSFIISCISALFFLLNPLQAEAVLWISGLQETLWVFFVLSAMAVYIRKKELTISSILLTAIFIMLSLLSKETAVCFIILFIAVDYLAFGFKRGLNLKYSYILNILILIFYFLVRSCFASIPGEHLPAVSIYFVKTFFSRPFKSLLFPWNQAYSGAMPGVKFAIAAIFTAIIFLYFIKKKPERMAFVLSGLGFLFVPLIPLTGMFFVASDLQGSRYLYLSSFGWGLLLSIIIYKLINQKTISVLIALFLVIMLSFCLKRNLEPWDRAGEIIKSLPADFNETTAPDNYYGAYILRNGAKEYKILRIEKGLIHKD